MAARRAMMRWLVSLLMLLVPVGHGLAAAAFGLDLVVHLDPASRQLRVSAELLAVDRDFRFVLHEGLRVNAASVAGKTVRVDQLRHANGFSEWRVRLPAAGERLRIDYGGQLAALDLQRDHRSVLQAMPPMSSSQGSFLPSASAWYPALPGLFSYRVDLTVPGEQRALVAGRRVAESLPLRSGDTYRATYEFRQPTDGIDLMAGPWVVREQSMRRDNGEPIVLRTYFSAALDATPGLAEGYLADTARYIERYSKRIGPYPYSEFSIVASPLPTGFGMPTLTYLGESVLRLPFIRQTSLGHEILHNWWGNGVYVDYVQGNWAEGLTTFLADYAYKEDESPAAAAAMRLGWLRDAAALPDATQPALRDFRSRTHGAEAAIGYGKSAMLFQMLRDRLGDSAFDAGLRNFWQENRFSVAGWRELQQAFEAASGQRLGDFFAAWFDGRALPRISVFSASASPLAAASLRHRLNLRIEQSLPALPLRLPIEITAPGKRETRWVDISRATTTVAVDVDFQPKNLRLDPEVRVWRRLEMAQLPPILRRWIGSTAPRLVNAGGGPEARSAVEQLAQKFFETPPLAVPAAEFVEAVRSGTPLLLAGTHADVDLLLAALGLQSPPELQGRGTAQVWTLRRASGAPLAVISARDAPSLLAMQRALAHYGGQSWLVFEAGRVQAKGVWPAEVPEVKVASGATPRR